MKQQIIRLSPHQNGKVFAILAAVGSLVFVVPFAVLTFLMAPPEAQPQTPELLMFLALPVFYLLFGYLMVVIGSVVYNFMVRYTGGIEFETRGLDG